ncbi:MAG TPA: hypothetical protein VJR94_02440 [Candidatus Nitrosocosmicus sp.]|nr:hypothetical protein [Candidatus Nitrosocosmicus sp.]
MNTKNSFSFVILAGLLTAAIGLLPLASSNNVFSQTNSTGMNMTTDDDMMMRDNYGKKMMGMGIEHKKYEKVNGTLNVMETMYQAIEAKFNVTLVDAITTAEQSVGNGSYAMSANGEEKDGFLVYSVILGSPDMKFTKVLVDPGNGEVLQTKNISMMEWMMMMHSQGHQDMGMKGMHGGGSSGQGYGGHEKWEMNPGSGW